MRLYHSAAEVQRLTNTWKPQRVFACVFARVPVCAPVARVPVAEYRERTLYGCMGREFGIIPPEAYPNYDPLSGTTTTSFP